jgi:hypothetical protein
LPESPDIAALIRATNRHQGLPQNYFRFKTIRKVG